MCLHACPIAWRLWLQQHACYLVWKWNKHQCCSSPFPAATASAAAGGTASAMMEFGGEYSRLRDSGMNHKEAWEKADKNWRVGVEYIYSQITNTLLNHGLTKIDPKGEIFDPTHHQSVAVIETGRKEEDGQILEVVGYGYSLNGKIIREPQVKVGQYEI